MPHCALPCHNLAISTNCRLGLRHYLLLLVLNPLLAVSVLASTLARLALGIERQLGLAVCGQAQMS